MVGKSWDYRFVIWGYPLSEMDVRMKKGMMETLCLILFWLCPAVVPTLTSNYFEDLSSGRRSWGFSVSICESCFSNRSHKPVDWRLWGSESKLHVVCSICVHLCRRCDKTASDSKSSNGRDMTYPSEDRTPSPLTMHLLRFWKEEGILEDDSQHSGAVTTPGRQPAIRRESYSQRKGVYSVKLLKNAKLTCSQLELNKIENRNFLVLKFTFEILQPEWKPDKNFQKHWNKEKLGLTTILSKICELWHEFICPKKNSNCHERRTHNTATKH